MKIIQWGRVDEAEQAAARNGSTGQIPGGALIQPWGFAVIDGHGHSSSELHDAIVSRPHSAVMERSYCLAGIQSRLAVFLLVDLSPSDLKAKSKGYAFPLSAPISLFGNPSGRVGIDQARTSKLKAR